VRDVVLRRRAGARHRASDQGLHGRDRRRANLRIGGMSAHPLAAAEMDAGFTSTGPTVRTPARTEASTPRRRATSHPRRPSVVDVAEAGMFFVDARGALRAGSRRPAADPAVL